MSCLFNSLGRLLEVHPAIVRGRICDYLASGGAIMDGMSTEDILKLEAPSVAVYVARMRLASTWGGAIEIGAACNIWDVRVVVENRRGRGTKPIEFLPTSGVFGRSLVVYWTGGHYEPVRVINVSNIQK